MSELPGKKSCADGVAARTWRREIDRKTTQQKYAIGLFQQLLHRVFAACSIFPRVAHHCMVYCNHCLTVESIPGEKREGDRLSVIKMLSSPQSFGRFLRSSK